MTVAQSTSQKTNAEAETVDQKIDRLAVAVKAGFDATATKDDLCAIEQRLDALEEKTTRIEATMVTKSYLDEKLFVLKGDLIVKMRKLEGATLFIASVLKERRVLTDDDVKRLRAEYQVFPSAT
ncbi:hypothetical protein HY634_02370 [Candidatus Uhrbacteria bacterium]|nr:hypothetical protein [Candidatus Uhrbacteria bacterium]